MDGEEVTSNARTVMFWPGYRRSKTLCTQLKSRSALAEMTFMIVSPHEFASWVGVEPPRTLPQRTAYVKKLHACRKAPCGQQGERTGTHAGRINLTGSEFFFTYRSHHVASHHKRKNDPRWQKHTPSGSPCPVGWNAVRGPGPRSFFPGRDGFELQGFHDRRSGDGGDGRAARRSHRVALRYLEAQARSGAGHRAVTHRQSAHACGP